MAAAPSSNSMPINWSAAGWALIGMGGSFLLASGLALYLFFAPMRGAPPIQHFSLHHPVLAVLAPLAAIGLAMLLGGIWAIDSPSRSVPAASPPLVLSGSGEP